MKLNYQNMKPLKPEEAVKTIDAEMIEAVNEMIKEKLVGRIAKFTQDELLQHYIKLHHSTSTLTVQKKTIHDLFDRNQLDFEPIYEKLGWKVTYDKPAYNETYPASFEFRMKKKHLKKSKVAEKSVSALAAIEMD